MTILQGDVLEQLATLPDASIQCCVTSPPYWGLRDYGVPGQLGLEKTPEEYVAKMVAVFREVRRVLREDGTCWVNLGDSYASDMKGSGGAGKSTLGPNRDLQNIDFQKMAPVRLNHGLKPKDICGIPWRVAFALQADGWYLRQDIIWHKPNPMPESVTDRCTKAHEYIFLLSKSARYYYDVDALREPAAAPPVEQTRSGMRSSEKATLGLTRGSSNPSCSNPNGRNRRSVWTITTEPYPEAHFATFPTELPKLCILAGTKPGDAVLDPFAGSGTTGQVALELARKAVLIELNPEYVKLIRRRCDVTPGLPLC